MTLRLQNSLTRKLEDFHPLVDGQVGLYVCGPTVYDYFHIGNARPFVLFDVVRRHLIASGYKVTFVQNVTDIDDKIINRGRKEGVPASDVAERFTEAYFEDVGRLGIMPADHSPRATNTIDGIIDLVKRLEERGLAYETRDGVYYRVGKFDGYGKLSGKDLDHLQQGASERTDNAMTEAKEAPFDFALWKKQKAEDEPAWESPWGMGRPGWHIECSAMAMSLLGESFDIHAGGEDLQFPHHENEIAQSEGATGKPFARYWLHNGFINIAFEETSLKPEQKVLFDTLHAAIAKNDAAAVDSAVAALEAANIYVVFEDEARTKFTVKGGKSLGNIPRVRDIFARGYDGREVRFLLLRAHYRSPLTFSWKLLDEARTAVQRWATARRRLRQEAGNAPETSKASGKLLAAVETGKLAFREAMDSDFNTPVAIAAAFEMVSAINSALGGNPLPPRAELDAAREALDTFEFTLGLSFDDADGAADALSGEEQAWLAERETARESRDFGASDRLRNRLATRGIAVEDTAGGQRWHRDEPANLVANLLPGKKGGVIAEWSQQLWDTEFRLAATDGDHHATLHALLQKLAADGKAELFEKDGAQRVRKKK